MLEPVNSVTMKVSQTLCNQSSPRTNNCLAYSNYSYSGIGPKERALSFCVVRYLVQYGANRLLLQILKYVITKPDVEFVLHVLLITVSSITCGTDIDSSGSEILGLRS